MPEHPFHLTALLQVLQNEAHLAEALFYPEVSCLDDDPVALLDALTINARRLLQLDDAADHHTRKGPLHIESDTLHLEIPPPDHDACWTSAVHLALPFVRWQHGDAAIAFIPALGIEVVAPGLDELAHMLPRHATAAILRGKLKRLDHLAWLGRSEKLLVENVPFPLDLPTPKQAAIAQLEARDRKKSVLPQVGDNLNKKNLPPAFEMDAIVSRLAEALTGRSPRAVLLIGPSGVGKTAIAHELVRRRSDLGLAGRQFWATSGARLVAGMCGFGMWQERCQQVLTEASQAQMILHMGNLMELLEVGKSEHQHQGLAGFLRPWLARGELLAICECTPEQLPLIERQDPHLARAFVQIRVEEPSPNSLRSILRRFAEHQHRATLTEAGLEEMLRLHRRYATYSANPGRPVRFLRNLLTDQPMDGPITSAAVTSAFSRETGLPRVLLEESERLDLAAARAWFSARVIGQGEAVDLVIDLLATVKAVLNRPRKPIASLLFIGPTGVGKTEMAKALAGFFFGSVERLTRFDMSEYSDPLAVQRLIGGLGGEGLLTARVREQPFSVVLLDEVEKADPQLFDLLLQVLGEGRLTDSAGRLADFCNAVVVMTSNLGAESYLQGSFGFIKGGSARDEAREHFVREVQKAVRPELFNRIDRIVPFSPLDEETTCLIARRQLDLLRLRDGIRYRGVSLDLADELPGWLARRGHDPRYGARPLKRAIEREMLAPLATQMNDYISGVALRVRVALRGEALEVQVRARTDEAGVQVAVGGVAASDREIAERCQALRRGLQAMQGCSAYLEVVNDLYRMERMARREGYHAELADLRKLRDSVVGQYEQASAREDEALLVLYGDGDGKPGQLDHLLVALEAGQKQFDESMLGLYLRRFADANQVAVVIYSEDVETMISLASAYWTAARGCTVMLYHMLPPTKPEEAVLARALTEPERMLDVSRLSAWKGVIGAGLVISGKAAGPRFIREEGQHIIHTNEKTTKALVCTSEGDIRGHRPPEGVERRGAIGSHPKRRIYRIDRGRYDDQILGDRLLPGRGVADSLAAILEELLWLAARELLTS